MRLFTRMFAAQLVLLLLVGTAYAQFETTWERTSRDGAAQPTPEWMGTATERSLAYGVVGGEARLYVASRSDGNRIRVLDPDTGDDLDVDISLTGVSGGALDINTVAVSDDGKIFVGNLTGAASAAEPFKIYMWTDEGAEPELVVEYGENGYRLADNLSVAGSVDDGTAVIYAATGTTPRLLRWAMVADPENDGAWVFSAEPVIDDLPNIPTNAWGTPAWAAPKGGGIDSPFLASGRSTTAIREYAADATTTGFLEVSGNRNIGAARYLAGDGSEYIAAYHPTLRYARLHEIGGEPGGTWTNRTGTDYGFTLELGPTVENTHGDIALRVNSDGTVTLFVLATSNGIGAFTTDEVIAEPAPQVLTVAEARQAGAGETVTFEAVVGRARGAFIYAQDETAGITLRQTQDAFRDSVDAGAIRPGTRLRVTGELSEFRHLLQINQGDLDAWEIIGQEDAPAPVTVTLQDLAENGEEYEGRLVRVEGLEIASDDEVFGAASSYDIFDATTDDGEVELRVPNESDTQIVGQPIPQGTFVFEGAVAQFSFDDPAAGYQLMVVDETDIIPPAPILDSPEWIIAAGDVDWFANDHAMRSGDYNPATDHLLVASRTGTPQVRILHPANGLSIGTLNMEGVEGGTYDINEISITEDGQIFAANLANAVGAEVRIYRWEDEDAAAEVVFAAPLEGPRYGDALHVAGSGDDVRIYISGGDNDRIAMLQLTDGEVTGEPTYIVTQPDRPRARMGIVEVPGQDSLWINHPGDPLTKIGLDGGIGREVSTDVVAASFGDIYLFEWEDRNYILTGPHFGTDHHFLLVDVTDPGAEFVAYQTMGLGENANSNAVGFATADWKRGNIIVGATNNAIAAFSLAQRENTAPSVVEIVSPADAEEIRIEGDGDQVIAVTWMQAEDDEGDTVLYSWQLSTGSDFNELLISLETGTDTTVSVQYSEIAALLDNAGVSYDESLTMYHRVVASDGELESESATSSVVLVRGTLTNIDGASDLPTEFALKGNYPNPFNPTTNIRFDLPEAADVRVEVYDILGRRVMVLTNNTFQAGANHNIRVDASALASGTYLYRIVAEMASRTRVDTGKMVLVK